MCHNALKGPPHRHREELPSFCGICIELFIAECSEESCVHGGKHPCTFFCHGKFCEQRDLKMHDHIQGFWSS